MRVSRRATTVQQFRGVSVNAKQFKQGGDYSPEYLKLCAARAVYRGILTPEFFAQKFGENYYVYIERVKK